MSQSMPKRIFAVAFSCEPGRGSEPGVGYSFAEALALLSRDKGYDITLLTRPHTLTAVEDNLRAKFVDHSLKIVPVSIPKLLVALTKRERVRLAYIVWQCLAVRYISDVVRDYTQPFVVHHITFATEAVPTFENFLGHRARRVFGPAGSSQALIDLRRGDWKSAARRRIRHFFGKVNLNGVHLAIADNDLVATVYKSQGSRKVQVEPNIVVPPALVQDSISRTAPDLGVTHELICVGILFPYKRFHMALEALAQLENTSIRMLMVGDGPLRADLQQLAIDLDIDRRVTFVGMLSRSETMALMARARVLVFPSETEGSAWAVGEAQAVGTVPVVCVGSGNESIVRLGGSGVVVADSSASLAEGINVALRSTDLPTERWSDERLPLMLDEWYTDVLGSD